jgi:hypothetical protein
MISVANQDLYGGYPRIVWALWPTRQVVTILPDAGNEILRCSLTVNFPDFRVVYLALGQTRRTACPCQAATKLLRPGHKHLLKLFIDM